MYSAKISIFTVLCTPTRHTPPLYVGVAISFICRSFRKIVTSYERYSVLVSRVEVPTFKKKCYKEKLHIKNRLPVTFMVRAGTWFYRKKNMLILSYLK